MFACEDTKSEPLSLVFFARSLNGHKTANYEYLQCIQDSRKESVGEDVRRPRTPPLSSLSHSSSSEDKGADRSPVTGVDD